MVHSSGAARARERASRRGAPMGVGVGLRKVSKNKDTVSQDHHAQNLGTDVSSAPGSSSYKPKGLLSVSPWVAFLIILVVRLMSARFNIIPDCDEVYNFWEPLHYLLHGTGKQTWEHRYDEIGLLGVRYRARRTTDEGHWELFRIHSLGDVPGARLRG